MGDGWKHGRSHFWSPLLLFIRASPLVWEAHPSTAVLRLLACSHSIVMVQVEEVPEDVLLREDERESDFETDSNASDASSIFSDDESFYDRFTALRDIVPPQTRSKLYVNYTQTKAWAWWGARNAGTLAWWVSTSALLVGLPLALAIEDETRVVQQEREMQMQSAGQQQVCLLQCVTRGADVF